MAVQYDSEEHVAGNRYDLIDALAKSYLILRTSDLAMKKVFSSLDQQTMELIKLQAKVQEIIKCNVASVDGERFQVRTEMKRIRYDPVTGEHVLENVEEGYESVESEDTPSTCSSLSSSWGTDDDTDESDDTHRQDKSDSTTTSSESERSSLSEVPSDDSEAEHIPSAGYAMYCTCGEQERESDNADSSTSIITEEIKKIRLEQEYNTPPSTISPLPVRFTCSPPKDIEYTKPRQMPVLVPSKKRYIRSPSDSNIPLLKPVELIKRRFTTNARAEVHDRKEQEEMIFTMD